MTSKPGWFLHNGDTITLSVNGEEKEIESKYPVDQIDSDDFTAWLDGQFKEHFDVSLEDLEFPPDFNPSVCP